MQEYESNYKVLKLIATGAYNKVYKVSDINTKTIAVAKIFDDVNSMEVVIREVNYLKELDHPHIIKVLKVFHDEKHLIVILPYIKCTLTKWIKRKSTDYTKIRNIITQIMDATYYMHSRGFIHADLKSDNILIDKKRHVYLIDMNISQCPYMLPELQTLNTYVQTMYYRAPELVLQSNHYSYSIDTWSIGCILAELIKKKIFFYGGDPDSNDKQIKTIFKILGTPEEYENKYLRCDSLPLETHFPSDIDPVLLQLLKGFLVINPKKRMTLSEGLSLVTPKEYESIFDLNKKQLMNFEPGVRIEWDKQKYVTIKMYNILIDWLYEVVTGCKLSHRSLISAVYIIIKYLNCNPELPTSDLQLVGISALTLSVDFYDVYNVDPGEYIYITNDSYTIKQFEDMKIKILKQFDFRIIQLLPYHYLLSYKDQITDEVYKLSQILFTMLSFNAKIIKYNLHEITNTCTYLASQVYGTKSPTDTLALECLNDLILNIEFLNRSELSMKDTEYFKLLMTRM